MHDYGCLRLTLSAYTLGNAKFLKHVLIAQCRQLCTLWDGLAGQGHMLKAADLQDGGERLPCASALSCTGDSACCCTQEDLKECAVLSAALKTLDNAGWTNDR